MMKINELQVGDWVAIDKVQPSARHRYAERQKGRIEHGD